MDSTRVAALVRVGLVDAGVPLEEISRLVGHSGTTVTELVYLFPWSSGWA
jgi:predicted transcriptional regulator